VAREREQREPRGVRHAHPHRRRAQLLGIQPVHPRRREPCVDTECGEAQSARKTLHSATLSCKFGRRYMQVWKGHDSARLHRPTAAGGISRGPRAAHRRRARGAAHPGGGGGGAGAVRTSEPHPAAVLAPALAPPLITPLARKLELLAAHGAKAVVVEPFTRAL